MNPISTFYFGLATNSLESKKTAYFTPLYSMLGLAWYNNVNYKYIHYPIYTDSKGFRYLYDQVRLSPPLRKSIGTFTLGYALSYILFKDF